MEGEIRKMSVYEVSLLSSTHALAGETRMGTSHVNILSKRSRVVSRLHWKIRLVVVVVVFSAAAAYRLGAADAERVAEVARRGWSV